MEAAAAAGLPALKFKGWAPVATVEMGPKADRWNGANGGKGGNAGNGGTAARGGNGGDGDGGAIAVISGTVSVSKRRWMGMKPRAAPAAPAAMAARAVKVDLVVVEQSAGAGATAGMPRRPGLRAATAMQGRRDPPGAVVTAAMEEEEAPAAMAATEERAQRGRGRSRGRRWRLCRRRDGDRQRQHDLRQSCGCRALGHRRIWRGKSST